MSCHHPVSRTIGQRSAGTTALSSSWHQVDLTYQEGSMFRQQAVQRAAARTTIQPQHHRVGARVILGLHEPEDNHHVQQRLECATGAQSQLSCADEGWMCQRSIPSTWNLTERTVL